MNPRHVIILRHGETAMSAAGLYASYTDTPLSMRGRETASAWSHCLGGVIGLHSPMVRAADTAELAGLRSEICGDLVEWNLGSLEGQSSEAYRQSHPDWMLFRDGAPGGEMPHEALARASRVRELARELAHDTIVLVGHGQFSKTLASHYLGLPLGTAARLSWGPGRAAVFSWRQSLHDYVLAGWNRPPPAAISELVGGNS